MHLFGLTFLIYFLKHTKASPKTMQGNYNLHNQTDFVIPQLKNINYDLESIWGYRPNKCLPNDLENKESVDSIKTAIKRCHCRLCKTYLQSIGYRRNSGKKRRMSQFFV